MEQNTKEWLEWRRSGIGASDLPIIMGDSPYKTPYQLWLEKLGMSEEEESESKKFVLNKGHEVEVLARNRYEIETGKVWEPVLAQHEQYPQFRASLDGYNKELNACWECKYIGMEGFNQVKNGEVPQKYKAQVHWQMFISGALENHLSVMNDAGDMATTIVKADMEYIQTLVKAATKFFNCMSMRTPPKLVHEDKVEIKDGETMRLIFEYAKLEREIKSIESLKENLKITIFKRIGHTNCYFENANQKITVQVRKRAGNINNKKLYKDFNISEEVQEKYRGKPSKSKVISIKEKKNDKN